MVTNHDKDLKVQVVSPPCSVGGAGKWTDWQVEICTQEVYQGSKAGSMGPAGAQRQRWPHKGSPRAGTVVQSSFKWRQVARPLYTPLLFTGHGRPPGLPGRAGTISEVAPFSLGRFPERDPTEILQQWGGGTE